MNAAWLEPIADSWWTVLVHSTWQTTLVALLLLGAVWLMRWSAPLRFGLLLIVLAKFAVPPFVSSPTGLLQWVGPVVESTLHCARETLPRLYDADLESIDHRVSESAFAASPSIGVESRNTVDTAQTEVVGSASNTPHRWHAPRSWKSWLLCTHVIGSLAVAGWLAAQVVAARRLVSRSMPVEDSAALRTFAHVRESLRAPARTELRQSHEIETPLAVGIIRPKVLLPTNLLKCSSGADLKIVLVHELAHIRRGDLAYTAFHRATCVVWWFHPLVWLLGRAMRRVAEHCCDDWVLARGVARGDAYCDMLLAIARRARAPMRAVAYVGMADDLHPLANRLRRIMDPNLRRRTRLSPVGMTMVVAMAVGLLPGVSHVTALPTPVPIEAMASFDVGQDKRARPPAIELHGMVVDPAGRPIPGARVHVVTDPSPVHLSRLTDARGRFTYSRKDPYSFVALWAERDGAVTAGAVLVDAEQFTATVRLTISESNACRFSGRVTDPVGRPIAGATIRIERSPRFRIGVIRYTAARELMTTCTTDGAGMFESRALWPGDLYHLVVSAPGFEFRALPPVHGQAGRTHRDADIVLHRVVPGENNKTLTTGLTRSTMVAASSVPRPKEQSSGDTGKTLPAGRAREAFGVPTPEQQTHEQP